MLMQGEVYVMAKRLIDEAVDKNKYLEIVVSTYWPTRIIKTVQVKNPASESSFHNDITLSREQAEYLCNQLSPLFQKVKTADSSHFLPVEDKENKREAK